VCAGTGTMPRIMNIYAHQNSEKLEARISAAIGAVY
jgi:hypothetical protein